jgi:hypothetical protein
MRVRVIAGPGRRNCAPLVCCTNSMLWRRSIFALSCWSFQEVESSGVRQTSMIGHRLQSMIDPL